MAQRESAHRNQGSTEAVDARTGRAEGLTIDPVASGGTSQPLAGSLDDLAALAAIRGDATNEALFSEAAALVRTLNIGSDADLEPLLERPPAGFSEGALQQLRYMFDAGAWVLLESAIADLPVDLRWLFESGAVTIPQLAVVHRALGTATAADLATELGRRSIERLPGLDESVESAIAAALPTLRSSLPRIPLGRAMNLAEPVIERLVAAGAPWALPVGSLRRGQDMVGDVEVVAPLASPAEAFDDLLGLPGVARTLHRSPRRLYMLVDRVQVGVRCPDPSEAGAALLTLTGTREHLQTLGALATSRGWTLTPRGLRRSDGSCSIGSNEEEIYAAVGLPLVPPEIREGTEAIDAALNGRLPALVTQADIRGDLHMHTQYSDGRDSIEAMVQAALSLGYEYIAITDHSPHSAATRSLTADDVGRQADEIARLRERYPRIAILHGCEVDILADGRLDFRDNVLQRFDIVLASLHEGEGHSSEQLLARYLQAMRHPLVAVITHPTNRVIPHRSGYQLDYERLFAGAAETGTVVEIDGAPAHLDLDGALARRAVAAGAMVAIHSDCHRAEMLGRQMQFGIMTARRGWVEAKHVLNTRPLAELRAHLGAKRR